MRFKRILTSVLTVACLFTCFATTASAKNVSTYAIGDTASPQYDIATSVSSTLNFVGTTAECISQGSGLDTVKITVVQTLQKYSGWFWIWDDVDGATWTKTVNLSSIYFYNTKSGLSSGKYRVKSVFTFTNVNGKTETLTIYSDPEYI